MYLGIREERNMRRIVGIQRGAMQVAVICIEITFLNEYSISSVRARHQIYYFLLT